MKAKQAILEAKRKGKGEPEDNDVSQLAASLLEDEEIDPKAYVMGSTVWWAITIPGHYLAGGARQRDQYWHNLPAIADGYWTIDIEDATWYKTKKEAENKAARISDWSDNQSLKLISRIIDL